MGYPVLASGYLLGTRGIGTFFAMMAGRAAAPARSTRGCWCSSA